MTPLEKIAELEEKLQDLTEVSEQAELILLILDHYVRIEDLNGRKYLERLQKAASITGNPVYKGWAYYFQAYFEHELSLNQKSIESSQQAVAIFSGLNERMGLARTLNNIGNIYNEIGKFEEAIVQFHQALRFYEQLHEWDRVNGITINISNAYYGLGNFAECLRYLQSALHYCEGKGDKTKAAIIYNNIGIVYDVLGDYPEALEALFFCRRLREELDDHRGLAVVLNNIGSCYHNMSQYEDALASHEAALEIRKKIDNPSTIANSYNSIATEFCALRRYTEALAMNFESIRIREELMEKRGLADSYYTHATVYYALGSFLEALKYYLLSCDMCQQTGERSDMLRIFIDTGNCYSALNNMQKAAEYINYALERAERIGSKRDKAKACKALSDVSRKEGDFLKALEYFDKYDEANRDIQNQEVSRRIAAIEYGHQIDQKERELAFEREKKAAVDVYAHKLEISNNELKNFAHVASHDLREPLRMVSSYLSLLGQSLTETATDSQKQFLSFAMEGAGRMERLIMDLLNLAKVDANPRIENVRLNEVIAEVTANLSVLIKDQNASVRAASLPTINADKTQMLQLFQNLISNAIKYNECQIPTVSIDCNKIDDEWNISVADNGIGIPEAYRERAFQLFERVPNTHTQSGTGLGLAICKKIIENMGGTISVSDNNGGGSIFLISLPVGETTKSDNAGTGQAQAVKIS